MKYISKILFLTGTALCLGSPVSASAGEISVAKIPISGGMAVFRLFDDPALLPECRGRGAGGVIADVEHPTKGTVGFGTGCWTAGVDGYIRLTVKSFDHGRVSELTLHNSKFIDPIQEMPTGRAKALINRVDRLAGQCRGGSGDNPKTVEACGKMDAAMDQVRQEGWCWGPDDAFGFEKRWLRCHSR